MRYRIYYGDGCIGPWMSWEAILIALRAKIEALGPNWRWQQRKPLRIEGVRRGEPITFVYPRDWKTVA